MSFQTTPLPQVSIVSIQVGLPREMEPFKSGGGQPVRWRSGIIKQPISGPVRLGPLNIRGDGQADLENHGGVDKAVLGYAAGHYPTWKQDLPECDFPFGAFGENLTLSGIEEATCCVGDVFEVGDSRLQISQPRQPCWKLARRWNLPDLLPAVQKSGRTGWYFRVLVPGTIEAGMSLQLVHRPFPSITVRWASQIMHARPRQPDQERELAACPALAESWKTTLLERASNSQ